MPAFVQPIANGALLIASAILVRGAIGLPIFALYLFFASRTPLADLATLAKVVGLAVIGGALGGLSYSLIGRRLRDVGRLGRYAAGITTSAPYTVVLLLVDRSLRHERLWARVETWEWIMLGILSALIGTVIGEFWFGDDVPATPHDERRTIPKILGIGAVLIILALWYATS